MVRARRPKPRELARARAQCEAALNGEQAPTMPRRNRHIEDDHQAAYFQWVDSMINLDPRYGLIYAVPNGGARDGLTAKLLKAQGVRKGVPDINVDVVLSDNRTGQWLVTPGLRIELKKPIVAGEDKPRVSPEQKWRLNALQAQGYTCVVAFGWDEAREATIAYLAGQYVPHQWAPSICL